MIVLHAFPLPPHSAQVLHRILCQVPYTNDCTTAHLTSTIIECAYDAVVIGLIKTGDEVQSGSKATVA